jgi:hypothetical protein
MKTSNFKKQFKSYTKTNNIRKSTPPLEKHSSHRVEIKLVSGGRHFAKYHCIDCNKWVAWVSKRETNTALKLGLVSD